MIKLGQFQKVDEITVAPADLARRIQKFQALRQLYVFTAAPTRGKMPDGQLADAYHLVIYKTKDAQGFGSVSRKEAKPIESIN